MFFFFHALAFAAMSLFGGFGASEPGFAASAPSGVLQASSSSSGGGSVPGDGGGTIPGDGGGGDGGGG
jgi:hypothetical protein